MSLQNFFNPKSIAIIGASHTPGKVGYVILENFVKCGYKGKVYPINPDTKPIFNLKVYPSIKKANSKIDLAVIAVPAEAVAKVLKECVDEDVEAVIIISAGFSETGKEGTRLEEKLKEIIARTKTRVIGPNVVGVYDSSTKVDTLFLSQERMGRPTQGNISFISQSGAVGSSILDWLAEEGIGLAKFISYGNAMDVDEVDLLEFLAEDSKTKVITSYLEGIRSEGKKFINSVSKITKKKPIIILKSGKSEKGTKAAASHTGSLAGSTKIYSAVFKQTGITEANNWEELFDFAKAFSMQPLPKGDRVMIITDGGGFGVLATDEAERQNLKLNEPSDKLKKKLRKSVPPYVILHNPIDLTGDATAERYKLAIEEALKSEEYDAVVAITLFQIPTLAEVVTDIIVNLAKKYRKPIVCCAAGGRFTHNLTKKLEVGGVPVYPNPERAVKAVSAMIKYSKSIVFKK